MKREDIIKEMRKQMTAAGITNTFLQAAILANIDKESGFILRSENLNYSNTDNSRIRKIFGSRVEKYSDSELNYIKSDPIRFTEAVYGMNTKIGKGMGNTQHGDGWKYRGRGFIQITGKTNYESIGKRLGINLIDNPDLILTDDMVAVRSTVEFFLRDLRESERNPSSMEEACVTATKIVGGRGLNLKLGYGAELLDKVKVFSKRYV